MGTVILTKKSCVELVIQRTQTLSIMLNEYKRCSISTSSPPTFFTYCLCPASRCHQPLASCLFPAPALATLWIQSWSAWLRPGVHCTYYSRLPVIYFSSELIAKSIWSGGKTSPKLATKSKGMEEAFYFGQHSLERQRWGKMLPHLVCRRSNPPRSAEGTRCLGPSCPLYFFSHPFGQKSLYVSEVCYGYKV